MRKFGVFDVILAILLVASIAGNMYVYGFFDRKEPDGGSDASVKPAATSSPAAPGEAPGGSDASAKHAATASPGGSSTPAADSGDPLLYPDFSVIPPSVLAVADTGITYEQIKEAFGDTAKHYTGHGVMVYENIDIFAPVFGDEGIEKMSAVNGVVYAAAGSLSGGGAWVRWLDADFTEGLMAGSRLFDIDIDTVPFKNGVVTIPETDAPPGGYTANGFRSAAFLKDGRVFCQFHMGIEKGGDKGSMTLRFMLKPDSGEINTLVFRLGSHNFTVNGRETAIDGQGSAPYNQDGVSMLPLRAVYELLGGTVTYDADTKTVTAVYLDTSLKIRTGETDAEIGGANVTLPAAPALKDGTTYVPARAVATALGAELSWDGDTQSVTLVIP